MTKQWSTQQVAASLGYLDERTAFRDVASHVSQLDLSTIIGKPKYSMFDVGCGNARKAFYFAGRYPHMHIKYHGIDINEPCLEAGYKHYNEVKLPNLELKLELADADLLNPTMFEHFDIAIADSTINMFDDPVAVVDNMLSIADIMILTRVRYNVEANQSVKGEHVWPGMTVPSPNWTFGADFIDTIRAKHVYAGSRRSFTMTTDLLGPITNAIIIVGARQAL